MTRIALLPALKAICAFFCATSLASAEITLGNYDRLQTRYGMVEIRNVSGGDQVFVSRQAVPGLRNWSISILGAWARAEHLYDHVVVSDHSGGNACDPPVVVLRVGQEGVISSPRLGGCVGPPLDIRIEPDRIEVDFASRDIQVSHEIWAWDGANVTVIPVAVPQSGAAGSGADVTRWIGQHPYRPFDDPSEQARFATIMTADQIADLARHIGPANSAVRRGDWVFGAGCLAHNCNRAGGRWGMRISDGAVVAAIVTRGQPPILFGPLAQHPAFLSWLAETRL